MSPAVVQHTRCRARVAQRVKQLPLGKHALHSTHPTSRNTRLSKWYVSASSCQCAPPMHSSPAPVLHAAPQLCGVGSGGASVQVPAAGEKQQQRVESTPPMTQTQPLCAATCADPTPPPSYTHG